MRACRFPHLAEWEEQIARFTERDVRFVAGLYQDRLKLYQAPAFFTLVNYEQVVRDADDINRLLKPDVVIRSTSAAGRSAIKTSIYCIGACPA